MTIFQPTFSQLIMNLMRKIRPRIAAMVSSLKVPYKPLPVMKRFCGVFEYCGEAFWRAESSPKTLAGMEWQELWQDYDESASFLVV